MKNQRRALAYGLVTVLLWSTVATAFKLSLRHMEPAQLLFWAATGSLGVLAAILAARGRLDAAVRSLGADWRRSLLMGFLNPCLYYLVLFAAYDRLPAQEAQPLNYTWAITLALLSIPMLGQRLAARDLVATAVGYLGVVVIATRGQVFSLDFADPLGVALALGSTVIWALYWLLSAKDTREPVQALFANFLLGWPLVLVATLLTSGSLLVPWRGLAGAAYVGVFEMGITFVTWLTALRYAENTSQVGNLIFLSPFVSLVFVHFLVGEAIASSTVVGLVLIMAGLAIQQLRRRPSAA